MITKTKNPAAVQLGSIRSERKAEAARENGKRGGRPINCPKCNRPSTFIRDRHFADGSGKVFTCENEECSNRGLYFYPKR